MEQIQNTDFSFDLNSNSAIQQRALILEDLGLSGFQSPVLTDAEWRRVVPSAHSSRHAGDVGMALESQNSSGLVVPRATVTHITQNRGLLSASH